MNCVCVYICTSTVQAILNLVLEGWRYNILLIGRVDSFMHTYMCTYTVQVIILRVLSQTSID